MKDPEISIIIPSYNEAEYLPKILKCLKKQTYRKFEVVVADNNSTDGTADIARSMGARVVDGGMPAEGRNSGARAARGKYFFFFDSDVKIARTFLKRAIKEMKKRNAELATCKTLPLSNLALDRFMFKAMNFFIKLNLERDPHAPGFCILVSRRVYEAVGGFNEELKLAEDHDFVKRGSKHAPLLFLKKVRMMVSVRRFRKEGRLDYMKKVIQVTLYRMRNGEISEDTFDYEFGNYDSIDESALRNTERKINKFDHAMMRFRKHNIRPIFHNEEPEFWTELKDEIDDVVQDIYDLFKKE
jgi:glycosyltransferase involved in cell wall biosynthesis